MPKSKTLVGATKGYKERNCDDLRVYEAPPEVKVFKAPQNSDWLHKFNIGSCDHTEPPIPLDMTPNFNGGKKKK